MNLSILCQRISFVVRQVFSCSSFQMQVFNSALSIVVSFSSNSYFYTQTEIYGSSDFCPLN